MNFRGSNVGVQYKLNANTNLSTRLVFDLAEPAAVRVLDDKNKVLKSSPKKVSHDLSFTTKNGEIYQVIFE